MDFDFTSERLIGRPPSESDAEVLFPIFSNPEVMACFGPERTLSREETTQWIRNHENLRAAEGFAPWRVFLKECGDVIGWGCLSRDSSDESPYNELIYVISPEHQGRGFGTELAAAAIDCGFQIPGLPDIETTVRPQNKRSVRILEKIGMTQINSDEESMDRFRMTQEEFGERMNRS